MQILKRKIEVKKQENNDEMQVSLTDGIRLCCRFHNKEQENADMLINFTEKETEKIKKVLRINCNRNC